jgi:hypothetical protein
MPGPRGFAATARDLIEPPAEFGNQRAHDFRVADKFGRGGVSRGMERHGLQQFMVRRNQAPETRVMVSPRHHLRQGQNF